MNPINLQTTRIHSGARENVFVILSSSRCLSFLLLESPGSFAIMRHSKTCRPCAAPHNQRAPPSHDLTPQLLRMRAEIGAGFHAPWRARLDLRISLIHQFRRQIPESRFELTKDYHLGHMWLHRKRVHSICGSYHRLLCRQMRVKQRAKMMISRSAIVLEPRNCSRVSG
jgi:hypothetical protein